MAALVDGSMPREETFDDIRVILQRFDPAETAYSVVLHLTGLRKRRAESARWLKTIAFVESESRNSGEKDHTTATTLFKYNVPALRKSRFVQKLR